ncbi:MAG: methyltransferase domain-containing protein [Sandaracinaceae bacterium]
MSREPPKSLAGPFYGKDLARIHHDGYGDVARGAARTLLRELAAAGHRTGTVVDLGCGSGVLARAVVDAGYDAVGFDLSPAMVDEARRNAPGATFHTASIWDAAIPSPVVGITAVGEILGYAADERASLDQVAGLLRRCHAALSPGGVLLFDVATPERAGPDRRAEHVRAGDGWSVRSISTVSDDGRTLTRSIEMNVRSNARERSLRETHVLRLYPADAVEALVAEAGFVAVERGEAYDGLPPIQGWVTFVARTPR